MKYQALIATLVFLKNILFGLSGKDTSLPCEFSDSASSTSLPNENIVRPSSLAANNFSFYLKKEMFILELKPPIVLEVVNK